MPARGIIAVFGPSGSGKTSCLRVLAGLDRGRGFVSVGGDVWQDDDRGVFVPTHERSLGFVFQEAALFPHLTVGGNLEYARVRSRAPAGEAEVRSIVGLFDIDALLGRRTPDLSGGERQRVAMARALLTAPKLLLMDEPLASLDVARKAEVLPYLERIRDSANVPVLYVSHSLEEVSRLATHIVLLDAGKTTASDTLVQALARLDLPLARFEDAAAIIEAQVEAHDEADELTRVSFEGGRLWVGKTGAPVGAKVRVRVLARDVSLARDPPARSSVLNVLEARVDEVRGDGSGRVNVRLLVGETVPLLARVTRRSLHALGLQPGVRVFASVKSVALVPG